MSVKESLEKTKSKIESMPDSETKRTLLKRANNHLEKYEGLDKVTSLQEIEKDVRYKPLAEPIPTGLAGLDSLLGYEGKQGGFYKKNHYVLSAPPKAGKTAMMLELVNRMQAQNPMLIPLEQPAVELVETMVERDIAVPKAFAPYTNKIPDLHWVEERVTEAVIKHGSEIVFIDHLSYLAEESRREEHLKIRKLMQGLKIIASELDIIIVTLVHINKHDPLEIPTVQALQGSSSIHQEASGIIMMWREHYKDGKEIKSSNNVLMQVLANRRTGNTGSIRLSFKNFRYTEDETITFNYEGDDDFDY